MMTAVGGGVGVACEDGVNLSVRGSSATNSSAMESAGRFDTGKPGRAAMSRESRAVASSRDNRARPMASSQGSTPDCASAEITVSGCPCRPSPIEANKNGSNSRPMPGASAACVMPSTHSVWRRSWKELARLPESSAREEETNRLPGALRLDSETTRFIVIWATKSLVLSALLRIDRDLDRHAQKAVGGPDETSDHRHDLTDVASDPDRNEVEAADASVCGIEADPTRARHEDLGPGVGRTRVGGSKQSLIGIEEIAGYDSDAEAERTGRLGEENREITARSPAPFQRLNGRLRSLVVSGLVADRLRYASVEVLEQRERVRPRAAHETARPGPQTSLGIHILVIRQRAQVRPFVVGISKRIVDRGRRDIEDRPRRCVQFELGYCLNGQRVRQDGKDDGRHGIAEHILRPRQRARRRHRDLARNQRQIAAFARTKPETMRAQAHGEPIAVGRAVSDSNCDHAFLPGRGNFRAVRSRSTSTQPNMNLMIASIVEQRHAERTFLDLRAIDGGKHDAPVDAAWILHVN